MKFIKRYKIVVLFIFIIILLGFNKNPILKYIGDETFGGCCYSIKTAKISYTVMRWHPWSTKPPQWANHQLARIAFVSGDFPLAIKYIDEEMASYPDNLKAYYIKGLILGFTANNHEAIEVFKYYTSQTRTWAGHNDLAWLYFKIGDYKSSLATIDKVYDTYKNNIWISNTRAIDLYNLARYKEAKVQIDHTSELYKSMTPTSWGTSYPGNDPIIYSEGYTQMGMSIEANKKLIYSKIK